jgi:hypothetical protein
VKEFLTRRKLLTSGAITIGGLALSGCDPLSRSPEFRTFLRSGEKLTMGAQPFPSCRRTVAVSRH